MSFAERVHAALATLDDAALVLCELANSWVDLSLAVDAGELPLTALEDSDTYPLLQLMNERLEGLRNLLDARV